MSTSPAVPTITLTRPDEVIAALPHILGFVPAESLVVLCLGAPGGGPTMRVDLPPRSASAPAVQLLAGHVVASGATRAVVVVWTQEADDSDTVVGSRSGATRRVLPRAALVDDLARALAADGIELVVALLVRSGRWWSFSCPPPCCPADGDRACAQPCCPDDGWALPDEPGPGAVRLAAEAVGAGRDVLPSRESLVAAVGVSGSAAQWRARGAAARRARRAEVVLRERAGADAVRRRTYRTARDVLAAVEAGRGVHELDEDVTAALRVGLDDRTARDLIITLGLDHDLGHVLALLGEIARRTPDPAAAPICTVLAWIAYQRGDGALARVALDRALAGRPDYAMARLLERGLTQMVPPRHVDQVTRAVRADLVRLLEEEG